MLNNINTTGGQRIRRQSRLALTLDSAYNKNEEISNDDEQKKAMHREIEKKRRQEMATLYSSLRSVLPLEFIKGKRSLADHMNEAVNYIRHLQTRIQVLGGRRDELQEWWLSNLSASSSSTIDLGNSTSISNSASSTNSSDSRVAVHPCLGGVEIVISTNGGSREQGLLLSTLMKVLLGQGLGVISCASAQVNKRVVFTIQSEVSDPTSIDFSGLLRVLTEAVSLTKVSK